MSNPTPPAMTREEWDTVRVLEDDIRSLDAVTFLEIVLGPAPTPEAAAAALLYDRSFGFTWEMVDGLREIARANAANGGGGGEQARFLERLAQQLAALLPPRDAPAA